MKVFSGQTKGLGDRALLETEKALVLEIDWVKWACTYYASFQELGVREDQNVLETHPEVLGEQ